MLRYKNNNQSGLASIMFAMFMALMITLLAIGFAVLVRNDQRQTLDKTLSNQAQYTAESAINMKQKKLQADPTNPVNAPTNSSCALDTTIVGATIIPELPDVKVTCLTWDSTPSSLRYSDVDASPRVVPIKSANATLPTSIKLTWYPSEAGATGTVVTGTTDLTLNSGNYPTLRIVAVANSNVSASKTGFIHPSTISTDRFSSGDGFVSQATCTALSSSCSLTISVANLPAGFDVGGMLAISSINGQARVVVQAFNGPTALPLKDAQVAIDATAKSQDVIRRLSANVPIQTTTWHPGFTAAADTMCKNYRVDGANTATGPISSTLCPSL